MVKFYTRNQVGTENGTEPEIQNTSEDALKKLYQVWEARHRNIVLMEFTRCLPDMSDREKIDYLTHSLGLMHLGRKNIMHSWMH